MTSWLIAVPAWGESYVEQFCAAALPALQRAIKALQKVRNIDVRLIIHTDQPERILAATSALRTHVCPVPAGASNFDRMSQAHREVIDAALLQDVVVPLTAGAVISEQTLVYCAGVLDDPQKKLVLCAVPRVLDERQIIDSGDAQALMDWGWAHRHPMVDDCTWPHGKSVDLSRVYFVSRDGRVCMHQCMPHPLAIRKDERSICFTPTVDANLFMGYTPVEMHPVLGCEKLAVVKLTPADRDHALSGQTMEERVRAGQVRIPSGNQTWSMGLRVMLRGAPGDCGDGPFIGAIRGG